MTADNPTTKPNRRWRHGFYVKGTRKPPEFTTWQGMIRRCHSPLDRGYENYGGRGIKVCDAWRESFDAFLEYMGPRPSPKHSIDRIDNDKGYEPGNVRWATTFEQSSNRRCVKTLTLGGETRPVPEWARLKGIPINLLKHRIAQGVTDESQLFKPPRPKRQILPADALIEYGGVSHSVTGWASVLGLSRYTIYARIDRGETDPARILACVNLKTREAL